VFVIRVETDSKKKLDIRFVQSVEIEFKISSGFINEKVFIREVKSLIVYK